MSANIPLANASDTCKSKVKGQGSVPSIHQETMARISALPPPPSATRERELGPHTDALGQGSQGSTEDKFR